MPDAARPHLGGPPDRCVCSNPVCLKIGLPSAGVWMKGSKDGSLTIVAEEMEFSQGQNEYQGSGTPVTATGLTATFQVRDLEGDPIYNSLKGTKYTTCKWKLRGSKKPEDDAYLVGNEPSGFMTETSWPNGGDKVVATHCSGVPALISCLGRNYLSMEGCPPIDCLNSTVQRTIVEFEDKECDSYILAHGSKDGVCDDSMCKTDKGCLTKDRIHRVAELPVVQNENCRGLRRSRKTRPAKRMAVLPIQFSRIPPGIKKEERDGWTWINPTMRRGKRSLHDFVRCCGFLMGPGGALWQYDLHTQGETGAASAQDVTKKLNTIVDQMNDRFGHLESKVNENSRTIQTMKETLADIVEEFSDLVVELNLTSAYRDTVLGKQERDLMNLGYCRESGADHCFCAPELIIPTFEPITHPSPIEALHNEWSSLFMWVFIIIIVFLGLAAAVKLRQLF
uniref:Putative fusion protein n=1 Tax=Pilchard orthomyxovirus TaxID=2732827 RepID=A0A6M4AJR7_9ORTO|nr:putative fusion protein [Pilchard orthomyxovirus]QJQ28602.1 putative fusion protein [Pilchard orthomyxovirus]